MKIADIHGTRLRKAARPDSSFILWLEEVCMKDYAIALWGDWRPSAALEELDLSGHEIIEQDDRAIGCIAQEWTEDALRLRKMYLGPGHRNRGIGAYVLRLVTERAHRRELPLRLSVITTNPAIRFYLREGFVVENETSERRMMIRYPDSRKT